MTDARIIATDVDDRRVKIVLGVLGITEVDAAAAFSIFPSGRPSTRPDASRIRLRVAAGLRHLRIGGSTMSLHEIARAVGYGSHKSVMHATRKAETRGLLTKSEITTLRNGGAHSTTSPASPAQGVLA